MQTCLNKKVCHDTGSTLSEKCMFNSNGTLHEPRILIAIIRDVHDNYPCTRATRAEHSHCHLFPVCCINVFNRCRLTARLYIYVLIFNACSPTGICQMNGISVIPLSFRLFTKRVSVFRPVCLHYTVLSSDITSPCLRLFFHTRCRLLTQPLCRNFIELFVFLYVTPSNNAYQENPS